ncbi:MAG: toll/interleukin-1 receptor domain-containing protein [Chloroflexi bacterium]|nr:MAG: toll/interleukin-1 receptor domain-containing protein [Chloroflexota bacterium]
MPDAATPIEIFYAYAPEDEPWALELEKHLTLLQRQKLITTWHPRRICAGEDWQQVTDRRLQSASVILLLISPDFLASDYCYSHEMAGALEREQTKGVRVVPILLRPVDWHHAPLLSSILCLLMSHLSPINVYIT